MTETKLPAWSPVEWARAHWPQRMLTDYLDDAVNRHPDKAAIVDYNSMSRKATTLTYRQLQRIVPRLGERSCAYVVLREGTHFDFPEMIAYLEKQQLARQYFPEYLQILSQMPMTVSGKIQKFQLREAAKSLSGKH